MMTLSSSPADAIRTEALALAASGAWRAVASLLSEHAIGARRDAELALLYAESRMRCGEERIALEWLEGVMAFLDAGGDRSAHRRATNMLGAAAMAVGRLDDAVASFGRAVELASEADDVLLLAQATNNLGAVANLRGEHELAASHYRRALPSLQRLGQPRRLAEGYHNMAITARDLGALDEADEHERRAIEYATDAGDLRLVAMGRVGRAELALRRGDALLAETTARRAAEELHRLGDPLNEADARRLVGAALAARGCPLDALAELDAALSLATAHEHRLAEAEVLRDRAEAHAAAGASARASDDYRRAVALFRTFGAVAEVERLERRLRSLGQPPT